MNEETTPFLTIATIALLVGGFIGIIITYIKTKKKQNKTKSRRSKNGKRRRRSRKDHSRHDILKPLQQKIESFEKNVDDSYKKDTNSNAILRQQIIGLKELNQQMSEEVQNLTNALKSDIKAEEDWGELVLNRVLEKSGLTKNQEYYMERSHATHNGKSISPDVVLRLPNSKKLIIDSNVSTVPYEQYIKEVDKGLQTKYFNDYIGCLKRHIEELSEKRYRDVHKIDSPDFILLYIPIEPAFTAILNTDRNIYNWAFEKNIAIVTPTILLATLRTIYSMWNNEKQQQNALEIARQANNLYDQFVNLTDDLLKIGNQLNTMKESHHNVMQNLTGEGNLVKKLENLKKLGSEVTHEANEKQLKEVNDD